MLWIFFMCTFKWSVLLKTCPQDLQGWGTNLPWCWWRTCLSNVHFRLKTRAHIAHWNLGPSGVWHMVYTESVLVSLFSLLPVGEAWPEPPGASADVTPTSDGSCDQPPSEPGGQWPVVTPESETREGVTVGSLENWSRNQKIVTLLWHCGAGMRPRIRGKSPQRENLKIFETLLTQKCKVTPSLGSEFLVLSKRGFVTEPLGRRWRLTLSSECINMCIVNDAQHSTCERSECCDACAAQQPRSQRRDLNLDPSSWPRPRPQLGAWKALSSVITAQGNSGQVSHHVSITSSPPHALYLCYKISKTNKRIDCALSCCLLLRFRRATWLEKYNTNKENTFIFVKMDIDIQDMH